MSSLTCKTCGSNLPGKHKPSLLDPTGIGNPGHAVPEPQHQEESFEEIVHKVYSYGYDQGAAKYIRADAETAYLTEEQAVAALTTASDRRVASELHHIRSLYDDMELQHRTYSARELVTWRGWKMIRNPITDRIEELTGRRDWRPQLHPTDSKAAEQSKESAR